MISGIIKAEVSAISLSLRLRLPITFTSTLIIPDITKNEPNNCCIIHCMFKKKITKSHYVEEANQPAMFLLRCAHDASTRELDIALEIVQIARATYRLFTICYQINE